MPLPNRRIVIIQFKSVEAAQRWHRSPEHAETKDFRTTSTSGWALLAPGF
jgi:uncharacterized protein (DUF1330 family)